jgi:hypothetical protein
MRKWKYVGSYPVIVVMVVSNEIEAGYRRGVMNKDTIYDYSRKKHIGFGYCKIFL